MTMSRQGPSRRVLRSGRFRRWRGNRPFWGGLWATLGGTVVLIAPLAPLPLVVQQGIAGISGYLLGVLLVAAGLLSWWQRGQRVFLGIAAMALSLASFVTSNLGGFGVGMLLGLTGGALLVAWAPAKRPGAAPADSRMEHGSPLPSSATAGGGPDGRQAVTALPVALVLLSHGLLPHGVTRTLPERRPATTAAAAVAVAVESGLSATRLTMRGVRFHGVIGRPTANGPRHLLKLSMDVIEISDGEHWIRHPGSAVRQRFSSLKMSGDVVMYVSRLRVRIGGVGFTFTPAFPPPLVPPSMTVTGVKAQQLLISAARADIDGLAQNVRT